MTRILSVKSPGQFVASKAANFGYFIWSQIMNVATKQMEKRPIKEILCKLRNRLARPALDITEPKAGGWIHNFM